MRNRSSQPANSYDVARTAVEAKKVFGLLPKRRTKCPYDYEITKDGRLIIDGEDFGNAEARFAEGEKLRSIVRLWDSVASPC
jgi:hypothetical protein